MEDPLSTAAVLAPIFRDAEGELRIVLVVRSDHGIHGGQLGFPGGRPELGDADMLETALRETEEEVGLGREHVEILGQLDVVETRATGVIVTPFLGRIHSQARWQLQTTEIVGLLTPAVAAIADRDARRALPFVPPGFSDPWLVDGVRVYDHVVFGLTLTILDALVPRLVEGEWDV
jgi:8-oxo-dGTP pyrophosphatase MutT (NUDIX family)